MHECHDPSSRRGGPERDAYLPLLHLADDSVDLVRSYYQTGTLFALDATDGTPVGMIFALPANKGTVELKAVAVDASSQGQGVGTRLLAAVLEQLRTPGTGGSSSAPAVPGSASLPTTRGRLPAVEDRTRLLHPGPRLSRRAPGERNPRPRHGLDGSGTRQDGVAIGDRRAPGRITSSQFTTSRGRAMAEPHVQADFALMQEIEIAVARNLQDFVTAYHHVAPMPARPAPRSRAALLHTPESTRR